MDNDRINVSEKRKEPGDAKILVIGVGGGGNNALNRMISSNITNVEFIAINTDMQDLEKNLAPKKYPLNSKKKTNNDGLGAGGQPEVAKELAEECSEDIEKLLGDANMVFITAGMGGGTGTGAAPVIAKIAKGKGILTIAVVTKPFLFEGKQRMINAERGIKNLEESVDTLFVIPNQKLKDIAKAVSKDKQPFKMKDAFLKADEVLMQCITGITNIIRNRNAIINLDFADVGTVMRNKGYGHVGIGVGEGENKVRDAIKMAVSSPLLETSVIGARSMIFNCTADEDTDFEEVEEAMAELTSQLSPDLEFFYGYVNDDSFDDKVVVTIIATDLAYNGDKETVAEPKVAEPQTYQISEPEFKFVEPAYQQPQTPQPSQSQQSGFTPVSEPTYQQPQAPQIPTGGFGATDIADRKGGYKIPSFLRNKK